MSSSREQSAEALRLEFDAGFSRAPPEPVTGHRRYLGIRVGREPFAIDLGATRQLLRCPPITYLPTDSRGLLGLVVVRGSLVAMYGLSTFLGAPMAEARWAVLCSPESGVGFAFEEVEGYLSVAPASLVEPEDARTPFIRRVITGARPRGVLDMAAVLRAIENGESKEEG